MTPHTPALYYDPRRPRPDLPRAALVLRETDKPGHVHLAVFSDPEFDIGRLPVEQARYVAWFRIGDKPAVEAPYCTTIGPHLFILEASKLSPGDLEAIQKAEPGRIIPPCPPPPPPGRMPTS